MSAISEEVYERCMVAGLLEELLLPPVALESWLDREALKETGFLHGAIGVAAQLWEPRSRRERYLALLVGDRGTGKTVAAVAALAELVLEARRRAAAGSLRVDRPAGAEPPVAHVTPERVLAVHGLTWETYSALESRNPGAYSGPVLEAYAARAAWDYARCPVSFTFWDACEVARARIYTPEFGEAIRHAKTCDVLIIDDLGMETLHERSPWPSIVDEVFNFRYSQGLVTIVTTNADGPTFRARYNERPIDRIREKGVILQAGGESMRRGTR